MDLSRQTSKIIDADAKREIAKVLRSLAKKPKSCFSKGDLANVIDPFLNSLPPVSPTFVQPGIPRIIMEILEACDDKNSFIDLLENSGKLAISDDIMTIATGKCLKDLYATLGFFSEKNQERCRGLLKTSFATIDLGADPGNFARVYSNFVLKNKRFDEYILRYVEMLQKKILAQNSPLSGSGYDTSKIDTRGLSEGNANLKVMAHYLKDFDPGMEALQITKGNLRDAVRLVQIVASDPGSQGIQRYLAFKLRRSDPKRAAKLTAYLENGYLLGTGKMAGKFFGHSIQYKWSPRNYKAVAGMALGVELAEKGYTEKESAWAAQFTGEAYRYQYLAMSKNRDSEKPYFILDLSAHYLGGILGARAAAGATLDAVRPDFAQIEKDGVAKAEGSWSQLAVGGDIMSLAAKAKALLK